MTFCLVLLEVDYSCEADLEPHWFEAQSPACHVRSLGSLILVRFWFRFPLVVSSARDGHLCQRPPSQRVTFFCASRSCNQWCHHCHGWVPRSNLHACMGMALRIAAWLGMMEIFKKRAAGRYGICGCCGKMSLQILQRPLRWYIHTYRPQRLPWQS